jgi:hypothetical protein
MEKNFGKSFRKKHNGMKILGTIREQHQEGRGHKLNTEQEGGER